MNLENVRTWQFQRMEMGLNTIDAIFSTSKPDDLTTFRDGGDGWTVLEVLCHLRDFEAVFMERASLTVEQDNPALPYPDPDELAKTNDYNTQKIADVFDAWKRIREAHLMFLRGRAEADWERPAQHPKRGNFTLHDQLFLTSLHDSLHIDQIMKILKGKQA